ncbi:hypothetical protein [Mycolicibacterium thermoresistibile]
MFVDELTRFAAQTADTAAPAVIERLTVPLTVAVRGRVGVGRRTVAAALTAAGARTVDPERDRPDVTVLVLAETLKPEDRAVVTDLDGPALVVLNKADRTGLGGAGPIDQARRRAAHLQTLTGVPTVPMVGLLAEVALDAELIAALRMLTTHPADLTSTDAFRRADHPLDPTVRARLLATLDRFGIAHAVLALSRGTRPEALPALLRRAGGVDAMLDRLHTVTAPVRYRRIRAALADLHAHALRCDDTRLTRFLSGDAVVLATMAAAEEVVQAAGLPVQPVTDRAGILRRAVHWHRYSRGPVTALHRACGMDICRGSLRLVDSGAGVGRSPS